jgi:Cof subfamily protein (haloacid dehalogenase superfamily)
LGPYLLVALDLDGTLLTTDKRITREVREAVDAARATGVRVALVTGRRTPSAREAAEELGGELSLVAHNGAVVLENGAVVRSLPLARTAARAAIGFGRERGLDAIVHGGASGEGLLLAERSARPGYLIRYYLERARGRVDFVPDLVTALDEIVPMQVMFGDHRGLLEPLQPALEAAVAPSARVERSVYPQNDVAILEVLDHRVGKAEAIAFLAQRHGHGLEGVLAIGDNWNDRAMLEVAGLGLLMGGGDPELQNLGFPVLPSSDENGVAVALERYILRPPGRQKKRG